jgi:hypothetical protein
MRNAVAWQEVQDELTRWHDAGVVAKLWLRDDDATHPSAALARLLGITEHYYTPVTLAIIPALSGGELASFLEHWREPVPAIHGWAHANHAPPNEKKQELGPHRSPSIVLGELSQAILRLRSIYGGRLLPLLVPPWNRMDPALLPSLPTLGYAGVSGFRNVPSRGVLPVLNTHVDLIDWGKRAGREHAMLRAELADALCSARKVGGAVGILGHHLVHDESCWSFLHELFEVTMAHPGCSWPDPASLIG